MPRSTTPRSAKGEPIVFIHGISSSWQAWLENLPHFGRTHRAIALDLPGFGASPMPSWPIDMHAYGRLVLDFCEKLGVEQGTTWSATRWAAWWPPRRC